MFMGEYQHTLDGKGRLILPAKIREGLGETFIATRGLDDCLFIYTREEWAALEGKLKQLSLVKPEARAFSRYIFSGAAELEADALQTHYIHAQQQSNIQKEQHKLLSLERDAQRKSYLITSIFMICSLVVIAMLVCYLSIYLYSRRKYLL
mgnify:CR=1 FL=1